jgi:hypothetical protein
VVEGRRGLSELDHTTVEIGILINRWTLDRSACKKYSRWMKDTEITKGLLHLVAVEYVVPKDGLI